MSDEEIKRWKEINGGLEYLTDINISRFLHQMFDASNKVYAKTIYLGSITDGNVDLLFSKARNVPKRKTPYQDSYFCKY